MPSSVFRRMSECTSGPTRTGWRRGCCESWSSGRRRSRTDLTRPTIYRVAGQALIVEAQDAWAAHATAALFAGWYLDSESESGAEPSSTPAIVMRSAVPVPRIPSGLPVFEIAGGGTCHTDGGTSYIEIDDSIV